MVSCAEVHRQKVWVVENVTEFLEWELFPAWRMAMESLGYAIALHVRDAADHGVPQYRPRAYLVCTRSRAPLCLQLPNRPRVAISRFIREHAGTWTPNCELGARTRARIERGRSRHGARFYTAYYGSARGGRSLEEPLGTVPTRDRFRLVDGDRSRMFVVDERRDAMSFPADYKLPPCGKLAKHLLGNTVCPVVATDILTAVLAQA